MKNTLRVKAILESIKATTKTKEKQQIIEDNKDDELFLEALNFLCNPYITTGLSSIKISKDIKSSDSTNSLSEAMKYIQDNNTGRDEDIAYILGFIETQDIDASSFLKEFFSKTYSIGIGASGINKVIPDFIPEFDVMLAESYDKNKDKIIGKEIIITYKLDGMRIICIKEDSSCKFFTRQGNEVEGLVELEEAFSHMPNGVYDGELLADGKFSDSKTLFQETMKRSRIKGDKTGLLMYCFDYIENPSDFYNKVCNTPCHIRKSRLEVVICNNAKIEYNEDGTVAKRLIRYLKPLYTGRNLNAIPECMKAAIQAKQEGLMINVAESPYECKRVKTLLKCKEFNTVDLRVIGYEEGQGDFVGTLGALLVDYKGHTVKVGSGFTQSFRQELWDNRDDIVGSIIEVKYFEETQNQSGGLSLRFPVFVRVRDDKSEPSLH